MNGDEWMYRDIDVSTALKLENACFVDVRSPSEFAQGTIPGAVNVPLFDDSQRQFIGLTYRKVGVSIAKLEGLKVVAPKLPRLVDSVLAQCTGKKPVVFCWRGGMRSLAVASLLGLVGLEVFRLEGGYKAFRQFILRELKSYKLKTDLIVIDGFTGVGKTLLLQKLKERGHSVLNLEELAGHRGSVFGGIGLRPRGQKMFDALLWKSLQEFRDAPYLLVEGESKKIGQVFLPEFLYNGIREGKRIKVEASLPVRVERILREYTGYEEAVLAYAVGAVEKLTKRFGKRWVAELKALLAEGNMRRFVEILLVEYYDPLYRRSQLPSDEYELVVWADDLQLAVEEIEGYLKEHYQGQK